MNKWGFRLYFICEALRSERLADYHKLPRLDVLNRLKALDIKLGDRQAVASLLSKAERITIALATSHIFTCAYGLRYGM